MIVIQAALTGIFCYLGALSVPWPFGLTSGWYTISRPLVSGLILGLIFGDVQQGIMIGVAVQTVYIAMITPGGVMPADLNFVAYPAMALALLSGSSTEVAVALAASLGVLGTVLHNSMMLINSYWSLQADKAVEKGDQKALYLSSIIGPQVVTFLLRFVPTFIIVMLGAKYVQNIDQILPTKVIQIMSVLGGVLPVLGIATLLVQIVHKQSLLLYFLVGFVAVVFLKLNTIALLIVGMFLAFMYIEYSSNTAKAGTNDDKEEF